MRKVIAIRRADRYSPNNIENDRMILLATTAILRGRYGADIPVVDEEEFCANPADAGAYLSMGRMPQTLDILKEKEAMGKVVINSPAGVSLCGHRSSLDRLMRQNGIAMPPLYQGCGGCWLKRGDSAAQSSRDVVFCPDGTALGKAREAFEARGIDDLVESTHVAGDLIKFYGVDDSMFHYYYTNDLYSNELLQSKFGNERINGEPHHYPFDGVALRKEVRRLAALASVEVFGGDAIIDKDGNFYIIDFNDWPTFSCCREDAAMAIANCLDHGNI